ncbi:biotin transporter BioY [Curtobacterium flaccumfaciens]|uniref:biotin transporter BioY n=1 Tax=Curtobacterium flaccumfaciens TaxID=2035 RepID=UPI000FFE3890|nr:biotin transporter BioY [Curtobacterium flaccumfaciens]MCS0646860.1 biotin transporter BioY [Curtobacterium flaccumfaciens pv. flaccumfaciens]MCS6524455.1 biotin transporter BioY [Curtobacterium flaccumfaciens pv. flaccumfaciens]MCS6529601.1 biotin transporter BioY [Curtobacterium flaccumfaciens pv. flaccumfaciens]NUU11052.1 biotin transporter BioY [Curtobacterium flaccumfaciens]RXF84537.1 biotin transporter BioY [Curtobacterium flaccumfaciens pv. flaccumfaciens]
MTTITLAAHRPLADALLPRTAVVSTALVLGGALLTAGAAQVSVPIWPVPITGQTLAVLLVGSALGARRGALSMLVYALLGVVGLPVFADGSAGVGVLVGPSGGYIVGFVAAAALVGWVAERFGDRPLRNALLSFALGTVVTFVAGMAWLAVALGLDLQQTLQYGLYPFVLGGVVKTVIGAGVISLGWTAALRSATRR